MQILHIGDQAGVACIFAKFQRLRGDQSKVIGIVGDKYGIYEFYKDFIRKVGKETFLDTCLQEAEHADIIHVHGEISALFEIRKKFGISKKIILHYHGTDIRGLEGLQHKRDRPNFFSSILAVMIRKLIGIRIDKKYLNFLAQKLADAVLVSTPDLLKLVKNGILVPIPVDIDHFQPEKSPRNQTSSALTFNTEVSDINRALAYCRENGIELSIEVHDRTTNPIKYNDMPYFMKKYRVYVDIRYIKELLLENLSSTALQSLACGLRVLDYKLAFLDRFPNEHDPRVLVSCLSDIYLRKRNFRLYIWSFLFRLKKN